MNPLTVVFGYRNREIIRVKRCLDSLQKQSNTNFSVIFVDYGSALEIASEIKALVKTYPFIRYIYNETRGLPWNRSHALNTGIRLAESEYLMTSDVDLIFPDNLITTILSQVSRNKVIHSLCYYLPKSFNKWNDIEKHKSSYGKGCKDALGLLQVLSKNNYDKLHGLDEFYKFWGVEDRDLHYRLLDSGIKTVWLNLETCPVYHQWHPVQNHLTPDFMPAGFWEKAQFYFQENRGILKRNNENWGKIYRKSDRPALMLLEEDINNHKEILLGGTKEQCLISLVQEFNSIKSGDALIVRYSDFKTPSNLVANCVSTLNIILRKLKLYYKVLPYPQIKKMSLLNFLEHKKERIIDYFIEQKEQQTMCLIVKK
jgi:glycosyltransferase involved in cell wall biosynthesis